MVSKKENSDSGLEFDQEVQVFLKVVKRENGKILLDTLKTGFTSSYDKVAKFVKEHGKQVSIQLSDYDADVSKDSPVVETKKSNNHRNWNSIASTTLSTIPLEEGSRLSIPSIRSSISSTTSTNRRGSTESQRKEPLLSSTKIDEMPKLEANVDNVIKSEPASVSNGTEDGHEQKEVAPLNGLESEKQLATPVGSSKTKTPKSTPSANDKGRAQKRKKVSKSMSDTTTSDSSVVQAPPKRQKQIEEPFNPPSLLSSTNGEETSSMEVDQDSSGSNPDPAHYQGSRILSDQEATELAKSMCVWGSIGIGEWVFARWRDKNYYSGKISKRGYNDTWHIDYDDDMKDVASEAHILPLKTIGMGANAVYSPDNIFRPANATVVGQKLSENPANIEYAIKCEGFDVLLLCKRRQLSLKESEAKELRKNYQANLTKAADVSLDNIIPETSRRRYTGNRGIVGGVFDASAADDGTFKDSGVNTPTPKKRVVKRTKSTTSHQSSDDNASTATEAVDHENPILSNDNELTPMKPKVESNGKGGIKDTPKSASKPKETAKKPKKETELFEGYQFFLTASGGGDPSSRGNDGDYNVVPYDKDEYRESIEQKGGSVIDSVGKEKGKKNVFLISDNYARTVKYIYCLAAGIPCVSHAWLGECLKQGKLVDWKSYELNSGYSLEQEKVIPQHREKPLKGLKIYVTAETDELYNYWKPVLTAAGATLLKPRKKSSGPLIPQEAELVVTDPSCSQEMHEYTVKNNIPIVMPEWLVQSIITGERASHTGHERYAVVLGEGEEEDE